MNTHADSETDMKSVTLMRNRYRQRKPNLDEQNDKNYILNFMFDIQFLNIQFL